MCELFLQQVHVNALILDCGMDTTGMETRPKERTPLPRASQSNPVSLDTWMQAKPKCAEHHQEIRNEYHRLGQRGKKNQCWFFARNLNRQDCIY